MNTLLFYLISSTVLFGIGLFGIIGSHPRSKILICINLIVFSAMINFMAFSKYHGDHSQMTVFITIALITISLQLLTLITITYKNRLKTNSRLDQK